MITESYENVFLHNSKSTVAVKPLAVVQVTEIVKLIILNLDAYRVDWTSLILVDDQTPSLSKMFVLS